MQEGALVPDDKELASSINCGIVLKVKGLLTIILQVVVWTSHTKAMIKIKRWALRLQIDACF